MTVLTYALAAAAAKLLQSCPTLCNPIDGSPPGSSVPWILQARTLEWVAISFSNAWMWSCSVVSDPQRLHGLQPSRLLCPWDFPGESTGVGCHCLLWHMHLLNTYSIYVWLTYTSGFPGGPVVKNLPWNGEDTLIQFLVWENPTGHRATKPVWHATKLMLWRLQVSTQRLNPGLPHCRQTLYQLSHKGSPRIPEWVAYPFSRGSSWPRNWTKVSCTAGRVFTNWVIREAWYKCSMCIYLYLYIYIYRERERNWDRGQIVDGLSKSKTRLGTILNPPKFLDSVFMWMASLILLPIYWRKKFMKVVSVSSSHISAEILMTNCHSSPFSIFFDTVMTDPKHDWMSAVV